MCCDACILSRDLYVTVVALLHSLAHVVSLILEVHRYVCMHAIIYIYIYIERERQRIMMW